MMQIIRDIHSIPAKAHGCSLAIGNFDGVHQGHQHVLEHMISEAKSANIPSAVMTFEPHPRRFFSPDSSPFLIEPFHIKARRLRDMGVDYHFALRFNAKFSNLTAQEFIQTILHDSLSVAHVTTGDNFIFGHKRSGDTESLSAEAKRLGFEYHALSAIREHTDAREMTCSSSHIRAFLAAGDMQGAADLLGRSYELGGRVRHGDKRGRTIGVPTANIQPGEQLFTPAFGVYAVRFAIMNEPSYGAETTDALQWHDGVANFGMRPTFAGTRPRLEVHGFESPELTEFGEFYGRYLRVQWLHYLRNEQKFDGIDALKAQITLDCQAARTWLQKN